MIISYYAVNLNYHADDYKCINSQTQRGPWVEHIRRVERPQRESGGIQVLSTVIIYIHQLCNHIFWKPQSYVIFNNNSDHLHICKGPHTKQKICTGLLVPGMSLTMLRSNILIRKTRPSSSMKPHCDILLKTVTESEYVNTWILEYLNTWIHEYVNTLY